MSVRKRLRSLKWRRQQAREAPPGAAAYCSECGALLNRDADPPRCAVHPHSTVAWQFSLADAPIR